MGSLKSHRRLGLFAIIILIGDVLATKRLGVIISGTTMNPGWKRLLGKASIVCPSDHPFSYGRGQFCCKHMYKSNIPSTIPECNGGKSNAYSDIRCCPNADYVDCSRGNTCKTFEIAQLSCPFSNPYAVENGFYCCKAIKRLQNTGINPSCNGDTLQVSDPKECCKSVLYTCPNNQTGCYTSKWRSFNATKMLIFGNGVQDMIMDLATNAISWSTNPSWPSYASNNRGKPFGGAYDDIMIMCEGDGGLNNICYRSILGKPGWYAGPNTLWYHSFPTSVMVQKTKLWVIGGHTAKTELFDFITQTWSDGPIITPPDLVTFYVSNAAPIDDNRVLVYGGCAVGGGAGSSATYLYDFNTGQWSPMGSMIVPTCDNGGGLTYLTDGTPAPIAAAGWNSWPLNSVQLYNVSTSTWTNLAQFPINVTQVYHCMANNRLFVVGGFYGVSALSQLWEIDRPTLVFSQIGSMLQTTTQVNCIAF